MLYANRCDENVVENDDHDISEDDELLAEPSEGDIPIMSFGVASNKWNVDFHDSQRETIIGGCVCLHHSDVVRFLTLCSRYVHRSNLQ
jgi:hypothetical protein